MANRIPRKLIKAGEIDLADLVANIKEYVKKEGNSILNEAIEYTDKKIGGIDVGDDITNNITNVIGQNMVVGNALPDFGRATIMCCIRDTKCISQGCGFVYKINVPGWIYFQCENVGKYNTIASNSLIAAQRPQLLFLHGDMGKWENRNDFPQRGYHEYTQLHPMQASTNHTADGMVMWPIMPGDRTYVRMVSQTTGGNPYLMFAPCKGVPDEEYDAAYNPITMQKFVYGWNPLMGRNEWQSSYFTRVGIVKDGGTRCSNTSLTAKRPDLEIIARTWKGNWRNNFVTKSNFIFTAVAADTAMVNGATYVVENTGVTPTTNSTVVDTTTWTNRKVPSTAGKTYYQRTERKYMELFLPNEVQLNSSQDRIMYMLNEVMMRNPGGINTSQCPTTLSISANGVVGKGNKGYHRFTSYGMAYDPRLMIYQCHASAHVITFRDFTQIHYMLFHEYDAKVNAVGNSSTSITATHVRWIHQSAFSNQLWVKKYIGDSNHNPIYGLYIKTSTSGAVKFFTKEEILRPNADGYVEMSGMNYHLKWLLLSADRWCMCSNTAYRLPVNTNTKTNSASWDYNKIYEYSKIIDICSHIEYDPSTQTYSEIALAADKICRWIPGDGGCNLLNFCKNCYYMTCIPGANDSTERDVDPINIQANHLPFHLSNGDGQWMIGQALNNEAQTKDAFKPTSTANNTLDRMPNHWNIPAGTIAGVNYFISWTNNQCVHTRWIPPTPITSDDTTIGYVKSTEGTDRQGDTEP